MDRTTSYYRARYYDPATGHFLSEDPARFAGGLNLYRYSNNNPVRFLDPFGLCPPTRNQRLALAARGVGNLAIGIGKVAAGIAVTAETGGLGAALGYYAIANGIVGNIGGGISQIAGAANGNVEEGEKGADVAASVSSVFGLGTLALSKGNICKAATAAQVEGIALTPFGAGLGEETSIADVADTAQNAWDLANGKGCAPPPRKCEHNCPQ